MSGLCLRVENGLCLGRVYGHIEDTAARHRHRYTRHASQTQLDTSQDTLYKPPIKLLERWLQRSEVSAIEWSINLQSIKQSRVYVLCVCKLSDKGLSLKTCSNFVRSIVECLNKNERGMPTCIHHHSIDRAGNSTAEERYYFRYINERFLSRFGN